MKTTIYKAVDRGSADYGWLKAKYSFSFSNYYNPKAVNFGALRVLNDDIIDGGMGFGTHPHDNMEIITIPLRGALKHKDSMSNKWLPLKTGEVQVMSAGTGIQHSEMNNSQTEEVNLFQLWIIPDTKGVNPKYNQKHFEVIDRKNKLQPIVSNINNPIENTLTIHQNAFISRLDIDANTKLNYKLNSADNGVYVIVIQGEAYIASEKLETRDAIGIEQTDSFKIYSKRVSQLLFIEVPMKF